VLGGYYRADPCEGILAAALRKPPSEHAPPTAASWRFSLCSFREHCHWHGGRRGWGGGGWGPKFGFYGPYYGAHAYYDDYPYDDYYFYRRHHYRYYR